MAEMIAGPGATTRQPGRTTIYGLWLDELGKYNEALKQAEATLDHDEAFDPADARLASRTISADGQRRAVLSPRHGECAQPKIIFTRPRNTPGGAIEADPQDFSMYSLLADIRVRNHRARQGHRGLERRHRDLSIQRRQGRRSLAPGEPLSRQRSGPCRDAKNLAAAVDCMRRMRSTTSRPCKWLFSTPACSMPTTIGKRPARDSKRSGPKLTDFPHLMKCLDYWIGYCYLQQGNPDQAMAAFRRSLSFDKFYFKAHDGIAQIFLANGQSPERGRGIPARRRPATPPIADAWLAFARTLRALESPPQPRGAELGPGRAALERAEELNPADGQVQLLIARVLAAADKRKDAEEPARATPQGVRPTTSSSGSPRPTWRPGRAIWTRPSKILDEARKPSWATSVLDPPRPRP